jgi:hypothetical protein
MEDRNNDALTTRSGKRIVHEPQHYGRYQRENLTLPGQRKIQSRHKSVTTRHQQAAQAPSPPKITPVQESFPKENRVYFNKLRSGSAAITCSLFGPNRRNKFPGYFFVQIATCGTPQAIVQQYRHVSSVRQSDSSVKPITSLLYFQQMKCIPPKVL